MGVQALAVAKHASLMAHTTNRRSLDRLAAKLFYVIARLHEQLGDYGAVRLYASSWLGPPVERKASR